MAITETNLPGNGTAGPFTYTFPALEAGDIYVSVDGVVKTVTTDYSLNFVDKQITFLTTPYPTVSNVIRIYRVTDDADLAATFYSGAAIRATDLNTNFTQGLYVTQESNREAATAISTAGSAVTTANAATATANSAVSTANAATATANTALSNSSAAVSTANTASSNASAAVSTANTASSNASAAVSTANTASSNATTAVSTANAATATANSAASDAATAISTANGAVTTANNAAADAATAISTANTASSNASAAVSTANTASSNATSAVNTANSALSTANAAASAVANAILYDIVANVAAIPASPANNDAVEVIDSTGIESFTPLTSIPGGFAGNSGLSVRIVYTTTGNTWTWIQYFPNDPETRYLKEAVTISDTAPVNPSDGHLWYDSVGGRAYVYYDDGDSSQWVDTSPQGSGVSDAISEGNTSAEVIDTGSDGRFVVTTEGSERLRITSAGLVGIGTNQPVGQTYIAGPNTSNFGVAADAALNIAATGGALANRIINLNFAVVPSATNAVAAIGMAYGSQSGFGNGHLIFGTRSVTTDTAPTERMRITSAGNVGIGTSSPSASARLDVNGNARIGSAGNFDTDTRLLVASTGGNSYIQIQGADSTGNVGLKLGRNSVANRAGIDWSASTDKLTLRTGGTSAAVTIDSLQRVGIGTTSPRRTLEVSGADGYLCLNATNTSTGTSQLLFGDTDDDNIGRIYYDHTDNNMAFWTDTSEKARIDSSGRLLVGTSSAANTQNLGTGQQFQVESAGSWAAAVLSTNNNNADGAYLSFRKSRATTAGGVTIVSVNDEIGMIGFEATDGSNSRAAARITAHVDGTPGTNDMPGRLVFSTTADGASSPTERMRITSNGTVGIGTTNPSDYMLGISAPGGKGGAQVTVSDTNRTPVVCANTATSGDNFLVGFFTDNFISRGSIDYNRSGGTVRYNTTSDARLKSNITDAAGAVNLLSAINVRSYVWAETGYKVDYGFVAQELHQVVPDAVKVGDSGEKVEDAWAVDYSKVVPVLTKALQEAIGRIETLEATNASLEARLTALEGGTN
jgi:hypothetical protein